MNDRLLRKTLRLNALVTTPFVVVLLVFNQPLADLMGGFNGAYLSYIAYWLIGFVLLVIYTSEQKQINPKLAMLITYMDEAWVFASIMLMLFASSWFSLTGVLFIALIAVVVVMFVFYEVKGLKQLRVQENTGG